MTIYNQTHLGVMRQRLSKVTLDTWDSLLSNSTRERVYIVTGNLLSGIAYAKEFGKNVGNRKLRQLAMNKGVDISSPIPTTWGVSRTAICFQGCSALQIFSFMHQNHKNMRTELNNNATLLLKDGNVAHVNKIIGSGGQGFVYSVTVDGEEYALKWYKQNPGNVFYENLREECRRRSTVAIVSVAKGCNKGEVWQFRLYHATQA